MSISILCGNITTVKADAIVNAANSALAPGGGVCGAIFRAAGYTELDHACRSIGHCQEGNAVITSGFALPARYIVHTVGPVWQGGGYGEEASLKSCYISSLQLAAANHCKSIAFPLISSGIFGYPKKKAMQAAIEAISSFLDENEMEVLIVAFDQETAELGEQILKHW